MGCLSSKPKQPKASEVNPVVDQPPKKGDFFFFFFFFFSLFLPFGDVSDVALQ